MAIHWRTVSEPLNEISETGATALISVEIAAELATEEELGIAEM